MSHMLPHLSLNTSTISVTYLTCLPAFFSFTVLSSGIGSRSPARFTGGVADLPNLHLPQVMSRKWSHPTTSSLEEIELDRNIGTDPYQIPERILGNDYQNPITEDTEETEKLVSTWSTSNQGYTLITIQLKALQTRILKMDNYEKCWPHCCMYMGDEKIMVLLTNPQLQGNQKQKQCRREVQVQIVLKLITLDERA